MTQPHASYEIFEEIGRGAETVVYRAHDLHLARDVAIKELLPAVAADPRRRERMLNEAKFLAQFDHPAILRIHAVEPERGWIVMDLMKGSLAAQISHAPLPAAAVQSILCQLLPALEFLHDRGKLHSSIRPSNILIDDTGRVKLSDFEESEHDGELRAPIGTKKYLAPELIRSDFGDVGPATDLYCLGFTALELLAGPAFESKILSSSSAAIDADVAWLRWHSSPDAFPTASKLASGVRAEFAQVIDLLLKKSVSERLQTAKESAKMLGEQAVVPVTAIETPPTEVDEQFDPQSMLPASVREVEPLQASHARIASIQQDARKSVSFQTSHTKRRNACGVAEAPSRDRLNEILGKPWVLYPLCTAMLLGAVMVGLALRQSKQQELLAKESTARSKPTETEPLQRQIVEPDPFPEFTTPPLTDPDSDNSDNQALEELAASNPLETNPLVIETAKPQPKIVAIEPDEPAEPDTIDVTPEQATTPPKREPPPRLEFVSTRVDVSDLVGEFKDAPELVIDSGGFISEIADLAISPDGKLLAAAGDKVVRIWEIETGKLLETLRGDRARTSYGNCNAVEFSRDGKHLVVGVSDYQPHGSIRVYRLDNLSEIEALLPGQTSPISKLDFSSDGRWMASVDSDGHVAIWDWAKREILNSAPPRNPAQPIFDELHFPSNEPLLAGIDFQGPLLMSAPDLRVLTGQDTLPPRTFAWIVDVLTRKVEYPFNTTDDPRNMDLRLDENQWAAAGVGNENGANKFWVGIWNGRTMEQPVTPKPAVIYEQHKWNVTAIDLAPEHRLAVSGDKFGEIHLWDSTTGERLHRFAGQGKPIYEAAFDRNSKRIAFGTKAYTPDLWTRNNYGSAEKILDLEKRAIYPPAAADNLDLMQEQTTLNGRTLKVTSRAGTANLAIEKVLGDRPTSRYDFTTGRNPTVFSFIPEPQMGMSEPVLLGDNLGLFAVWDSDRDELKRSFIGHEGLVSAISRSANGKLLLTASADRTMRIWNMEDHRETGKFDFKYENSVVTSIQPGTSSEKAGVQVGDRILSIAGKTIAVMHREMLEGKFNYKPGQTVQVTMQRNGESYTFDMTLSEGYDFVDPVLSIYIGNDNQWIIWTPRGYYDASPGAEQLLGWHINCGPDKSAKYFQVQQFRKQLYRPDIINRILAGAKIDDAVTSANEANQVNELVDFRSPSDLAQRYPPEINFISPTRGEKLSQREITLQAMVTSRNGLPIREVTLIVNGVATEVFHPIDSGTQSMRIDYLLTIQPGRNELELIAANAESTSSARSIDVTANAPEPVEQAAQNTASQDLAKLNVLAIGISDYAAAAGEFQDLPLAASDARTFSDTAKQQAGGLLYSSVQTRVLTDRNATRTAILDGLQWLVDTTEDGDTIAIFVAAHGFVDSTKNFYVGTHDVDVERPRATAISWREFTRTLHEDLPSCRRLVFLDLQPTEQAVSPDIRNPLLDLAAPELATVFFSSNSLQQTNLPAPSGNVGYSTDALTMALSNPAADIEPEQPDSLLNASEISRAWTAAVRELSDDQFYPVAFTPESSKHLTVLQLKN